MSEISRDVHCAELRGLSEDELVCVLETVDSNILIKALQNKINKLEQLEIDMLSLFKDRR